MAISLIFKGDDDLWSETKTTERPSDASLALTNSVKVMFDTTEGRWKCENNNTLMRYLMSVLYWVRLSQNFPAPWYSAAMLLTYIFTQI